MSTLQFAEQQNQANKMLDLSRQSNSESRYGSTSDDSNNMIAGEDEPDLSGMLRAGVDIEDDGEFDPTNLLSQPINFNESIDELDININSNHSYNDHLDNGHDSTTPEGDRHIGNYYDHNGKSNTEAGDPRETYFRTPSPDSQTMGNRRQHPDRYNREQDDGRHTSQRHSPRDYEPPPYKNRRGGPSPKQRQGGRNSERIAEVQKRIRQVQQQIHENMDDDQNCDRVRTRVENRPHSYRRESAYPRHEDHEHLYSNKYPGEHFYDNPPGEGFPPREYPRHGRPRSFNGMPSSRDDGYDYPRRHSHQEPVQRQQRGPPMMSHSQNGMHPQSDPLASNHDNKYGPEDRSHPLRRDHNDHIDHRRYRGGPSVPQHQHVLGGMSQSLNASNNNRMGSPIMRAPQNARPMSQSYNNRMNSSTNGNMPRRGIQSMSDSLNGLANPPSMDPSNNGMNRSRNGMDRSSNRGIQSMSASLNGLQNMNNSTNVVQNGMLPTQRGIQSMSASLNGMRQMSHSTNGIPQSGYGGPEPMAAMNGSMNGMPNMHVSHTNRGNSRYPPQHRGASPMSASQNCHPLQGMSQSLNGISNVSYSAHNLSMRNRMPPGDHGMQMDGSNNREMMNRSNNAMGRSMNGSMNASNGGTRSILSNSSVPTAPLLNQVSNLANLPNRGASMMQVAEGPDTTKLSRKLMEAMKRTASSRKLIRDLNIASMIRGDLKSPASSKAKSVVKAKRNAVRQSYTKSQSEAAASREFAKAQKQQEKEEKEMEAQPQQVAV